MFLINYLINNNAMKILIKVTKDILKKSSACSLVPGRVTENCAVALAVRDLFPEARVGFKTIRFFDNEEKIISELPFEAQLFIRKFDDIRSLRQWKHFSDADVMATREALPEFFFEIDVPQEVIDRIGLSEVYRVLSESKTLELITI